MKRRDKLGMNELRDTCVSSKMSFFFRYESEIILFKKNKIKIKLWNNQTLFERLYRRSLLRPLFYISYQRYILFFPRLAQHDMIYIPTEKNTQPEKGNTVNPVLQTFIPTIWPFFFQNSFMGCWFFPVHSLHITSTLLLICWV